MYRLLETTESEVKVLYCNTFMVFLHLLILFIVAIEISPLVGDASILINDASDTLHDFSVLMPKINSLIPEAKNTTKILGRMIPEINQGLRILRQLCLQDPQCHLYN